MVDLAIHSIDPILFLISDDIVVVNWRLLVQIAMGNFSLDLSVPEGLLLNIPGLLVLFYCCLVDTLFVRS